MVSLFKIAHFCETPHGRGEQESIRDLGRSRPNTGYKLLIMGTGSDDGKIAGEKDLTEIDSSSVTSKTVNSLVICNRDRTLLVRLSSFSASPGCACS
jgi:hypothetical protein